MTVRERERVRKGEKEVKGKRIEREKGRERGEVCEREREKGRERGEVCERERERKEEEEKIWEWQGVFDVIDKEKEERIPGATTFTKMALDITTLQLMTLRIWDSIHSPSFSS
jgi:hypothetical protein